MADGTSNTSAKTPAGFKEVISKYMDLVKDVDLSIIREINVINSNILTNGRQTRHATFKEEDFHVVDNILQGYDFSAGGYDLFADNGNSRRLRSGSSSQDQATPLYFADEEGLMTKLREELESLGLESRSSNQNRVCTTWLLDGECKDIKTRRPLADFHAINKLKDIINAHPLTKGTLNGCIVNCFRGSNARLRPHADDERYIDQTSSICTFSLGSTRDFKIFENKHKDPKCLKTFTLKEKSVSFMQPGSQSYTKHKVMPGPKESDDIRYSISFRCIINNPTHLSVTTPNDTTMGSEPVGNDTTTTAVIFGSSIPYYLDSKRLSGRRNQVRVINASVRGAYIKDVHAQMESVARGDHEYFQKNSVSPDQCSITTVIISVGTNDVLSSRKGGVNHLYSPLEAMLEKAKLLFPDAQVHVQSMVPVPLLRDYNRDNVLNFNKLTYRVCKAARCYLIDVFSSFLYGRDGHLNDRLFRVNKYSGKTDIHPNSLGLSVLARAYIKVIRGHFDPNVRFD
jgi:alkylated DNA repair dioxygenase AlkB/lysophospholipase L1-like esterase